MKPEKLNLWDRLFNRYRRIVVDEGREIWTRYDCMTGYHKYHRHFVKYKVIDRVTGSEIIEKKYL
jgi:hypothetical protein